MLFNKLSLSSSSCEALDRLVERMRPDPVAHGPKIVKHNGKALHQGRAQGARLSGPQVASQKK